MESGATATPVEIRRAVLNLKITNMQAKAYDLSLGAALAKTQAGFYEGEQAEKILAGGEQKELNARSLYAAVAELQAIHAALPEPAAPKPPDSESP